MVAVQVPVVVQTVLELHAVQVLSLSLCDALQYFTSLMLQVHTTSLCVT